ncbi:MAG: HD-GYP domain-containing protein [Treponema sp.]|jgi:HD-GYP domain-containing protein (c-di-GMP phosphodiesterase class II)|nr:HD-GYP domain-containing protein [Treponema sp.]
MTDPQGEMKIYLEYTGLIKRVEEVFAKIAMNRFIVKDPFSSIAEKIYEDGSRLLKFIVRSPRQEYDLAKNAVDTALLSTGIAKAMGLADFTIRTLLVGSLVHDVGMFSIPQSILKKNNGLVKAEQRCIFAHPIHGYNIIVKELRYHNQIGFAALQHHEHWDSTGYPQGLSGTDMSITSRIIAIGDAFSAMTSPRSYRLAMTGHQAMNHLVHDMAGHFDPEIFQVFVSLMGKYPPGSLVRLNTGATALVIEQTDRALQPRIRILTDKSGEPCGEEEELNLIEKSDLFITGEAEVEYVI